MKVSSSKPESGFQPFDLTIRIETEEEAKQFYFMFDYVPLVNVCYSLDAVGVRSVIKGLYKQAFEGRDRLSTALVSKLLGSD